MTSQRAKSVVGLTAALVCVIVLTVVTTLSIATPAHAFGGPQYKVLMYQGGSPQELEGMLNSRGQEGWKFVQLAGPFVIFQK